MALVEDVLNVSEEVGFPPICTLINGGVSQSIQNGALEQVTFDTVVLDNDGMADLVNNWIVIKTAGFYQISYNIQFNPSGSGGVRLGLVKKEPVQNIAASSQMPVTNAVFGTIVSTLTPSFSLAVNESLGLYVWQDSGINLVLNVTAYAPSMSVRMVGP